MLQMKVAIWEWVSVDIELIGYSRAALRGSSQAAQREEQSADSLRTMNWAEKGLVV